MGGAEGGTWKGVKVNAHTICEVYSDLSMVLYTYVYHWNNFVRNIYSCVKKINFSIY